MDSSKKWVRNFILILLVLLVLGGAVTVICDPYFHFHKPFFSYLLDNERYQNDGIAKHFSYDAIITGSSLTENYLKSEFDALFNVDSIKLPLSGATYKEVNDILTAAFDSGNEIKYVIRCLDCSKFFDDKDAVYYEKELYPTYLYDKNPFNDVSYIFNKSVLFTATLDVLGRTKSGRAPQSFDEYAFWGPYLEYGPKAINEHYQREDVVPSGLPTHVTDEEFERIKGNITQNVSDICDKNKDTVFYIYPGVYSIYYYDYLIQSGELERYLEAEEYILKLLLEHENIKVFAFDTETDIMENPMNYRDLAHTTEKVNSEILRRMSIGENLITKENIDAFINTKKEFLENYDFEKLFVDNRLPE